MRESEFGRQSSALDPKKGLAQRAAAEMAFLIALNAHLPVDAFRELHSLKPQGIPRWLKKWNVNAPCVKASAAAIVTVARRRGPGLRVLPVAFVVSYRRELPRDWRVEVSRLNALPMDSWLEDVVGTVAEHASNKLPAAEREQLNQWLAAEREKLLSDDRVLAPIAADPMRESREGFLNRADNHWNARMKRARAMGGIDTAPKPQTYDHADWLARNLCGESIQRIGDSVFRRRQAVAEGIRTIADLVRFRRSARKPNRRSVSSRKK